MVPAMSAPALRANSSSSANDSRPASPTGMPGKRGARFQPTPTSNTRSATEVSCCVFMEYGSRADGARFAPMGGNLLHQRDYTAIRSLGYTGASSERHAHPVEGDPLNFRIIAKAFQPLHSRFAPKPGDLPLRIAP